MPDYSKAIVYKLCCKDTNITDIYIGSTCNFSRRKNCHKSFCNNEKGKNFNFKVYQFIRDNNGWNNWDMIQIEAYPECINKRELGQYERFHIEELKPALNCNIPNRTQKEWCVDNKDKIKAKYVDNKDKIKAKYVENKDKIKDYRNKNKEIIAEKNKEYRIINKDKIKDYRNKNKEILAEKKKEYYDKNINKILEQKKEKIVCECGSEVTKVYLSQHKKSKKHISIMNLTSNPSQ